MASNRDPRKDYRINRRGRKVTSSADRSKRAKKASAPKPTSSSTRAAASKAARQAGGGSRRVTSSGGRLNRAKQAMIGRMLDKSTKGKRPQRPITGNTPKPSTKIKKTDLKLQGTWAQKRAREKAIDKKWGANNRESGIMNEERLKMGNKTNSNEERAMRLRTRNKVVKGPGNKAVRKKPVTGPPRGASGPRNPPVQGPSRKTGNIVADVKPTSNKPQTGGPPTPGVKFDPSKRVKTAASIGTLLNPRSDVPAKALAAGSLAKDVYDATRKPKTKTKMKPSPGMSKGAVAKAKSDASKTNRQSKASSFDRAFATARKAGKSTFTWKGKKYNTKIK